MEYYFYKFIYEYIYIFELGLFRCQFENNLFNFFF